MYRYNYLSHQQQKIREQDFAACQGELLCVAQHSAKWDTINVLQTTSYGAGLLAGVPAGIVDSVQGLVQLGLNPGQTLAALKSLITSDDLLGNASAAVKQSYLARVEAAEAQYQKAGASGSFNAGMEYGKLLTDAATLVAGGVGAIKGGALLTEKITAKLVKEGVGEAVNAGTKSMAAVDRGVADAGRVKGSAGSQPNNTNPDNIVSLPIEEQIGILRDAAKGNKGNFGLGQATAKDANALGESWVGPGYRVSSDGKAWVSSDGLRIYRPPSSKSNSPHATTGVQANFEQKLTPTGRPISNGHLDITK